MRWAGQPGPQGPDPLIPNGYIITAATHPLATLAIANTSAQSETFTIDLFIADQGPPPSFYGSSTGISSQNWPGVIWDWASQPSTPRDTLTAQKGTSVETSMDWPQVSRDGRHVDTGHYWAVVTASPTGHADPINSLEAESPIVLATSLPPLPRENCLGYPAAATVSGLPSPFRVHLDPGVNVPGAETTFAGIRVTPGHCNLSGPDPEVAVLAFTNPGATPVSWAYDVVVIVSDVRDGPGPEYCDAHNSVPAANSGTIVVPGRGVASVTLWWPHCPGNAVPAPTGFYVVGVSATSKVLSSSAAQLVHLAT